MSDITNLGIKDVLKNKCMFLIVSAIIAFLALGITLGDYLLKQQKDRVENNYDAKITSSYIFTPVKTDMSNNEEFVSDLAKFVEKYGVAYTYSTFMEEKLNKPCYVVVGDLSILSTDFESVEKDILYTFNDNLVETEDYKIVNVISTPIGNEFSRDLFTLIQKNNVVLYHTSAENAFKYIDEPMGASRIVSFAESIIFKENAFEYDQEIRKIFDQSFLDVTALLNAKESYAYEKQIYYMFWLPYILILILVGLISYKIINESYIEELRKEYKLHIFYGATKKDILLRNRISFLISILCTYVIFRFFASSMLVIPGIIVIVLLHLLLQSLIIFPILKITGKEG